MRITLPYTRLLFPLGFALLGTAWGCGGAPASGDPNGDEATTAKSGETADPNATEQGKPEDNVGQTQDALIVAPGCGYGYGYGYPGYGYGGYGYGGYNPPGYNPPGAGPYNPPGYNPPGYGGGYGYGYPGYGYGYGGNANGGWNHPGPF
jgi:hypothetical protein